MSGYIGGGPAPSANRKEAISEKFPEAVASGRVSVDMLPAVPAATGTGDGVAGANALQGGYKVRTLAEQLADNRRKADEDFMDEFRHKGPKALDDEEFEFIEGTNLAKLRKRLLEEAEEKEALADFHSRKATMVHDATELIVVARPDVPDVAKKALGPGAGAAKPKPSAAPRFIAVAKTAASAAGSTATSSSSSTVAVPKPVIAASNFASTSVAKMPAKSARTTQQSPSSSATQEVKPAPSSGLAMLGGYADSDEG